MRRDWYDRIQCGVHIEPAEMNVRRTSSLHLLALALLLFLCVSLNDGFTIRRADDVKPHHSIVDRDADPEDETPLVRDRRGIKIRPPKPKPKQTYQPAPKAKDIEGIPNLERARPKTPVQGGGGLRQRYSDKENKKTYEWDSAHGELERYGKTGKHEGSYDHKTGEKLKDAVPGRKIEP